MDPRYLAIYAPPQLLEQAKKLLPPELFSRLQAQILALPCENFLQSDIAVILMESQKALPLSDNPVIRTLVDHLRHHPSKMVAMCGDPTDAFEWGKVCQKADLKNTVWAQSPSHLEQIILKQSDLPGAGDWVPTFRMLRPFSIKDARNRLGITQEQMAKVLDVTARTIQNWESGLSLSLFETKTRELRHLLALMDEYVPVPTEDTWLRQSIPALNGASPLEVILTGRFEALIVEFERLDEGMPV
jgi:DNA-binding XRE family transcriptional regulator